jgi:hypothetical protein
LQAAATDCQYQRLIADPQGHHPTSPQQTLLAKPCPLPLQAWHIVCLTLDTAIKFRVLNNRIVTLRCEQIHGFALPELVA